MSSDVGTVEAGCGLIHAPRELRSRDVGGRDRTSEHFPRSPRRHAGSTAGPGWPQDATGVEAVVFCGIQASGKTTFYRRRFAETHVRLSMDLLRTRRREAILLEACLRAGPPFVIDNPNGTPADR